MNAAALTAYARPAPCQAMMIPPSDGPRSLDACMVVVCSVSAFIRCTRGTSAGISETRAGWPKDIITADPREMA